MTRKQLLTLLLLVFLVAAGIIIYSRSKTVSVAVTNFDECLKAGYTVATTYPRQCRTPEGTVYKENIGNVIEKEDLIRVSSPMPNATVQSPLTVTGMARGTWYFEASFPVKLKDSSGKIVVAVPAQAKSDWMTTEFVPFEVTLTFTGATPGAGQLILQKDNPSGLPEKDDSLIIPVVIKDSSTAGPVPGKCYPSGCSGQICSDKDEVSNCEYKAEYACYKQAKCERQASGQCGWTETAELKQCLQTNQGKLPTRLPE